MPVADAVLEHTNAVVMLVGEDGAVEGVSPAGAALLGASPNALMGQDAAALLARPRDVAGLRQALRQVGRSRTARLHETHLHADDGAQGRSMIWAVSALPGPLPLVALVGIDISATRSELDELQTRALTDELTGLANRAQFMRTLQALAGTGATVLFCDLNGFKAVNDTYGHAAGDEVLVEVRDAARGTAQQPEAMRPAAAQYAARTAMHRWQDARTWPRPVGCCADL